MATASLTVTEEDISEDRISCLKHHYLRQTN
jgi:hypothetical protein